MFTTFRTTFPPWQNDVAPEIFTAETFGIGFTTTFILFEELTLHPEEFVTVIEYVPAAFATKVFLFVPTAPLFSFHW